MKKLFLLSSVTLLAFVNLSYAATETVKVETVKVENVTKQETVISGEGNAPVVVQPQNKHAGPANTPVDQEHPAVSTQTTTVRKEVNVTDEKGSLYESVRSGWNSFIDLLTGPKR